jgi:hypothetical protein
MQEPAGKWAVVVISQSMDLSPTGGDPIAAARRLGGIVNSANIQEEEECVCTMLFDHTFDVRSGEGTGGGCPAGTALGSPQRTVPGAA